LSALDQTIIFQKKPFNKGRSFWKKGQRKWIKEKEPI